MSRPLPLSPSVHIPQWLVPTSMPFYRDDNHFLDAAIGIHAAIAALQLGLCFFLARTTFTNMDCMSILEDMVDRAAGGARWTTKLSLLMSGFVVLSAGLVRLCGGAPAVGYGEKSGMEGDVGGNIFVGGRGPGQEGVVVVKNRKNQGEKGKKGSSDEGTAAGSEQPRFKNGWSAPGLVPFYEPYKEIVKMMTMANVVLVAWAVMGLVRVFFLWRGVR